MAVNFALLMYLFLKAWKMLYLLKLYLLYLAVTLASSNIIITPQILIGFVLLLLIYQFVVTKCLVEWGCEQTNDSIRVTLFYCLLVITRYCILVALRNISVDCTVLPAKPLLTAHRGCKDVSTE